MTELDDLRAFGSDDELTDPWEGIPAELLDGTHSYDTDSAGGCG